MVLSCFVAMLSLRKGLVWFRAPSRARSALSRLPLPTRQHVIYEPGALVLAHGGVPDDPRVDERLVRGLQHALQVRGVALREGKLCGQPFEVDAPRQLALLTRHLEQAVEPPGDGGGELLVVRRRERDGVRGGDVGPQEGREG